MSNSTLVFAYFGPETLLPVTSIVATIVGIVMMLGRGSFGLYSSAFDACFAAAKVAAVSHPHFQVRDQEPVAHHHSPVNGLESPAGGAYLHQGWMRLDQEDRRMTGLTTRRTVGERTALGAKFREPNQTDDL